MTWLLFAVALAHGPDDCPPIHALTERVKSAPLPEKARKCVADGTLDSVEGRLERWVGWRDDLWRAPSGDALRGELDPLLAATTDPERALDGAEALADIDKAAAADAWNRAGALLSDQPWSTPRVQTLARHAELDMAVGPPGGALRHAQTLNALGIVGPRLDAADEACTAEATPSACAEPASSLLPAASPDPDALKQCLPIGRLYARTLFGGVYATDRDCVVRLAGTLEGAARDSAARLALALALRHNNREEALLVAHRVAELLPTDAGVARTVADLHGSLGDDPGLAWWNARARTLSNGDVPPDPR